MIVPFIMLAALFAASIFMAFRCMGYWNVDRSGGYEYPVMFFSVFAIGTGLVLAAMVEKL